MSAHVTARPRAGLIVDGQAASPYARQGEPPPRGGWSWGYSSDWQRCLGKRSATGWAWFLLPHLRPGMHVLDCSHGDGLIALGLAEVVAPGRVVHLDTAPEHVACERQLAALEGIGNAQFAQGDVQALGVQDASFDAAFAADLLARVPDPLTVLRELRRVLKPGGVVGVCDTFGGMEVVVPSSPLLLELSALMARLREQTGNDLDHAARQRGLLLAAGFTSVEGYAFCEHQGTTWATRAVAREWAETLRNRATIRLATARAWGDEAKLEAMAREALAWGERPDAFRATLVCAAVGRAGAT